MSMAESVTARGVVLNLVRVSPRRAIAVRQLIEVGALFGFAAGAVRVAVARLTAQGLLESDERGSYRLGPAARSVGEHVEQWRRGEARMRAWGGGFLAVILPPKPQRRARRASLRALARMGFAEGPGGLWLRPDNLRVPFDASRARLQDLGLEAEAELFVADRFSAGQRAQIEGLWPVTQLQKVYARNVRALERSLARLPSMPHDQALVQSFLLGGEAIRVLARDPLLPPQIMPCEGRAELTARMLRYDEVGHEIWRRLPAEPELKLLRGGRRAG